MPTAPSSRLGRILTALRSRPAKTAPIEYTPALVVYVTGVVALAVALFVITYSPVSDWTAIAVLAAAVVVLGYSSDEVVPGLAIVHNVSTLVNLGLAVTFGPIGCLVGGLSEAGGIGLRMRNGWFRGLFNGANFFLANWVAFTVFTHLTRLPISHVAALCLAGIGAGTTHYLANDVTVAGVVAVATRSAYFPRLRGALATNWFTLILGWGAPLFPVAYEHVGSVGMTWVLAPLIATQALLVKLTYRMRAHTLVRNALLERIQEESARVERSYESTLIALTHALDARDRETEGHSRRVVEYTREIAVLLGVDGTDLTTLSHGALLHDLGKIGVPDAILHKPSALTEEEWELMRRHPLLGAAIIEDIEVLKDARSIILHHHERWDGLGYPKGLRGNQIALGARIFAVADAVDAITQDRPYRLAMSLDRARVELQRHRGRQFDPDAVDAFLSISETRLDEIQGLRTPLNIDILNFQAAQNESYLAKSGLGIVHLRRHAS